MQLTKKQNGSVSLFVVIFAALLITVVTIGFVSIMVQNQQQASSMDLSQSAYDSAQAGIEDAKRAIINYQNKCSSGGSPDCISATNLINSPECNASITGLVDGASQTSDEIKIQTDVVNKLDQAYTCVKIKLNTDDYVGVIKEDENKLITLSGELDFNTIKLEWFNQKDLDGDVFTVDVPEVSSGVTLLDKASWTTADIPNRPSMMRAQLIRFDNNEFSFSSIDETQNNNVSDNSLFFYPSKINTTTASFIGDVHKSLPSSGPIQIFCNSDLNSGGYSCSVTIAMGGTVIAGEKAYLNLKSIYKKSNFRVALYNSNILVKFKAVQPEIDSTGRANDLFRRVVSRVDLGDVSFPYPQAAVDVYSDFCKSFMITDISANYLNSCDPSQQTTTP